MATVYRRNETRRNLCAKAKFKSICGAVIFAGPKQVLASVLRRPYMNTHCEPGFIAYSEKSLRNHHHHQGIVKDRYKIGKGQDAFRSYDFSIF